MKKSLLLSMALVPVAALATVNVNVNRQVEVPALKAAQMHRDVTGNFSSATYKANSPVKALRVAPKADLAAAYYTPAGAYYCGRDQEGGSYKPTILFAPGLTNLTWYNLSTGATSYSWKYATGVEGTGESAKEVYETSVEKNLTYPAVEPFSMFSTPELTAFSGSKSDVYDLGGYVWYGGFPVLNQSILNVFPDDYNAINSNESNSYAYVPYFGAMKSGGSTTSELLAQIFSNAGLTNVKSTSIYQVYPAPADGVPYLISQVSLTAYCSSYKSDRLVAKIWKVNEQGQLTDVCYEGYVDGSELPTSSSQYVSITIPLYETQNGLESETLGVIDSAIAVEITGFDDTKDSFTIPTFLASGELAEDDATFSYFGFDYTSKGKNGHAMFDCGALTLSDKTGNKSYPMMLDLGLTMYYNYMIPAEDDVINFSTAGETKTVHFDSLIDPSFVTVSGDGEGDWWSASVGEADETTGLFPIEFTAAPLAEGKHKNWAMANVSTYGASAVMYLLQDDGSSVEGLEASKTSAKVVNGDFEVESENATAVAVYNLAGQKVAEAAFDGKATVPAADLAKGVYVLKFNNNMVVKLAK